MSFENATTTTGYADLRGKYPVAIENAASGPTSLTFQILAQDGVTWIPVNENGADITLTLEGAQCLEAMPASLVTALMGRRVRFVAGSNITKTLYLYTGS